MSESDADARPSSEDTPEDPIGFPTGRAVDVSEIDARFWRVLTAFDYQAKRERFTIPVGERTDFASVPRPFVWFIPTYGRYTKAAILHDHLCGLARNGQFSRRDADGLFQQAMRSLGVALLRRWVMWAAVRWGALFTPEGRKGWLRDAWLVIPITLLVLPIVLLPAVLIVLALIVWFGLELIVWIPLTLVSQAKAKSRKPTKKVNPPKLTFRL